MGDASPIEIPRPPIEISALDDQTKKVPVSANKSHQFRPNIVTKCGKDLVFFGGGGGLHPIQGINILQFSVKTFFQFIFLVFAQFRRKKYNLSHNFH